MLLEGQGWQIWWTILWKRVQRSCDAAAGCAMRRRFSCSKCFPGQSTAAAYQLSLQALGERFLFWRNFPHFFCRLATFVRKWVRNAGLCAASPKSRVLHILWSRKSNLKPALWHLRSSEERWPSPWLELRSGCDFIGFTFGLELGAGCDFTAFRNNACWLLL